MIDFTTDIERKRCKQLSKVQDIVQEALDCLGQGIDTRAVTYKLLKLRNYLNKQFPDRRMEKIKSFVHNEMVYANNSYDRACHIDRNVDIEFWGGKVEAFTMVENKIKAILGGEKDESKSK